jgi:NADH dehydrogenase FAD-containing subunit
LKKLEKHINIVKNRIAEVDKSNVIFESKNKLPYGICVWMTGPAAVPLVSVLKAKNPSRTAY